MGAAAVDEVTGGSYTPSCTITTSAAVKLILIKRGGTVITALDTG